MWTYLTNVCQIRANGNVFVSKQPSRTPTTKIVKVKKIFEVDDCCWTTGSFDEGIFRCRTVDSDELSSSIDDEVGFWKGVDLIGTVCGEKSVGLNRLGWKFVGTCWRFDSTVVVVGSNHESLRSVDAAERKRDQSWACWLNNVGVAEWENGFVPNEFDVAEGRIGRV